MAADKASLLQVMVEFGRYANALGFAPCESGLLADCGREGFRRISRTDLLLDKPAFLAFNMPPAVTTVECKHAKGEAIHSLKEELRGMEGRWRALSGDKEAKFDSHVRGDLLYINVQPVMAKPDMAKEFLDEEFKRQSRRGFLHAVSVAASGALLYFGGKYTVKGGKRVFADRSFTDQVGGVAEAGAGIGGVGYGLAEGTETLGKAIKDTSHMWHPGVEKSQWQNFILALEEQLKPQQIGR